MVASHLEHSEYVPDQYYKCSIPVGMSGDCEVRKFEVKPLPCGVEPESLDNWARRRPGEYTVLLVNGQRMMTDLYEEWWSQRWAIRKGLEYGGHILITGLGLGLIVDSLLRPVESSVRKITVIEKSRDVIELVGRHLLIRYGDRLEIIETDALDFQPPASKRYSVVWHDIWPNPLTVPPEEVKILFGRFQNLCSWQGFWNRESYEK